MRTFFCRGSLISASILHCLISSSVWAQEGSSEYFDKIQTITTDFKKDIAALPAATSAASNNVDIVLSNAIVSLDFAAKSFKEGKTSLAVDAMSVVRGALSVSAPQVIPNRTNDELEKNLASMQGLELTALDIANVQEVFKALGEAEMQALPEMTGISDRLEQGGFDIESLNNALSPIGSDLSNAINSVSVDVSNIINAASAFDTSELSSALSGTSISEISRALGAAAAAVGASLQDAANAISASIAGGVGVDLDAAAQGLGYSNFSDAVDAYNAENGTNFTVNTAKSALGQ